MELKPPAVAVWSLNHWTARDIPISCILSHSFHEEHFLWSLLGAPCIWGWAVRCQGSAVSPELHPQPGMSSHLKGSPFTQARWTAATQGNDHNSEQLLRSFYAAYSVPSAGTQTWVRFSASPQGVYAQLERWRRKHTIKMEKATSSTTQASTWCYRNQMLLEHPDFLLLY